jgi:hypothetical protein
MSQKHGHAGQRKRRTEGHNSSRAEIRNQSAYGKSIWNHLSDYYIFKTLQTCLK